jgi:hypothetical protein
MGAEHFEELADFISQVILKDRPLAGEVLQFRKRFTEMKYCLPLEEANPLIQKLLDALG